MHRHQKDAHLDRHLIHVNPLFDTKLGDIDVEGCIKHANNLGLAHDWTITLSQIGYQDAQV